MRNQHYAGSLLAALAQGKSYDDWKHENRVPDTSARRARAQVGGSNMAGPNTVGGGVTPTDPVGVTPPTAAPPAAPPTGRWGVPPSPAPRADDAILRLEGDYAIISDLHCPYHDPEVIERFLDAATGLGLTKFIVLGDSMDANQLHPKRGQQSRSQTTVEEDVETTCAVYRAMLAALPDPLSLIAPGNHDGWIAQHMRGQVDPEWLFSRFFCEFRDRLRFASVEQCRLTSGGETYLLTHGANYSAGNPLGPARDLSAKFELPVVMGHEHHHTLGYSRSGRPCLVMGGAYDPTRLAYLHGSPRTNPVPTRGFAAVKDGRLYEWSEKDWS